MPIRYVYRFFYIVALYQKVSIMASNMFFADGQWNFICDLCGKQNKSANGTKAWDGFYVCKSHKERRNPQDLLKMPAEVLSIPWSRPEPPDVFVGPVCTIVTSAAIPNQGFPGCIIPGNSFIGYT